MTSLATLLKPRATPAVSLGDSVKSDGVSKSTAAFGELLATILSDDKKQAKAREGVSTVSVPTLAGATAQKLAAATSTAHPPTTPRYFNKPRLDQVLPVFC